jgi:hypothetical protein
MRTGFTTLQQNIIDATTKKIYWLVDIDRDNDGTAEYTWSTHAKTWGEVEYSPKIIELSPLSITLATPELSIVPPTKATLKVSFPGSQIDGLFASDFEGSAVTIRLIGEIAAGAAELMAWRFVVVFAASTVQILTLGLQDRFTKMLEGDYPNGPLISNLFPADIMKNDNVCDPVPFGNPFYPVRWIKKSLAATYVDADSFTVAGDKTALFSVGQFLLANCGVDGQKGCWVASRTYSTPNTTINLTAVSADLTSNLATVQTDHYFLGLSSHVYTIDRARTPREVNFKTTYLATDYTFKQDTIPGSDGNDYRVVQAIICDGNKDGANDANGFWGIAEKQVYDMPLRVSRDDTATTTDPALIAKWIFLDWGIPVGEIDDVSRASASAIFAARSLTYNFALWQRMPREKVISKLFAMANMVPLYRDAIGFKVLSAASVKTITEAIIKPGSFQSGATFTQKEKDSGYVTWQIATEPADSVNKNLIAAKTTTDRPGDTTIEAEWILDSVKAQKAGKLALQRILLKDKTITFTGNSCLLALEPGDMVTITGQNHGDEGGGYKTLITKMTIREGCWIDFECLRFTEELDTWDSLTPGSLTVDSAATEQQNTPLYQGPANAAAPTGEKNGNTIYKTLMIGDGGTLATNEDPATNGGFMATNTDLTCYNEDGEIRLQVKYGGADQGDVEFGDYTGGHGIKWDQGDETLTVKVDSTGGITVSGGGDITLTGSDTDPGRVKFEGTAHYTEIGADADGNKFGIFPDGDSGNSFYLGTSSAWWGEPNRKFDYGYFLFEKDLYICCGTLAGAYNASQIWLDADQADSTGRIRLNIHEKATEDTSTLEYTYQKFTPYDHKLQDLGGPAAAWDDAYADDFNNVADFFHLDYRKEGQALIPVDDLEIIRNIKPGGIFDQRTGLETIDDNSLPEWLLTKCKKTGEILRDPDGKPYLALKTIISLCLGAIRQLGGKIEKIKTANERE